MLAALALSAAGCGSSAHHQPAGTTPSAAVTPTASRRQAAAKRTTAKRRAHSAQRAHTGQPARTLTTAPSPGPAEGLRPSGSYGMYELCAGRCSGSVPASLERPLRLPSPGPGGSCPTSRASGPVAPSGSANVKLTPFLGSAWEGAQVTWRSAASYQGPVLIRGGQLGGSGVVGFGEGHVPYDQLQLLDSARGTPRGPSREWPSFTRVRGPGCYAYQVDGTSFSNVIVFRAT